MKCKLRYAHIFRTRNALLLVAALVTACATKRQETQTEIKSNNVVLLTADDNDIRLQQTFEKTVVVPYWKDQLTVKAILQLPEIEMPLDRERNEKLTIERKAESGVHVFNGYLCIQIGLESSQKTDYSKKNWKTDLIVDGHKVKFTSDARPRKLYNLDKFSTTHLPGQMDITVCSKSKMPKVSSVKLTLKDKKKAAITEFDWQAPWPPIHMN